MGAMMNYGRGAVPMAMSGIGSALMAYGGPVGWAVGGLMTLGSMLFGKKKKTVTRETTWTPEQVKDMISMIGMDIAPLPKMYALPKSRWHGRTSPISVNINIDRVEGTDAKIAEKIAEKVSVGLTKVLPRDYQRNINRGELSNRLLF